MINVEKTPCATMARSHSAVFANSSALGHIKTLIAETITCQMKKLISILFLLTLTSCHYGKNGILVEIKNKSDRTIHNVTFSSDANTKLEFERIEPNESVEKFLDMTNNQKGDGSYGLIFQRENGNKEQTGGGYYTNGASLDRKVVCEVRNDTILMKFSGTGY